MTIFIISNKFRLDMCIKKKHNKLAKICLISDATFERQIKKLTRERSKSTHNVCKVLSTINNDNIQARVSQRIVYTSLMPSISELDIYR